MIRAFFLGCCIGIAILIGIVFLVGGLALAVMTH